MGQKYGKILHVNYRMNNFPLYLEQFKYKLLKLKKMKTFILLLIVIGMTFTSVAQVNLDLNGNPIENCLNAKITESINTPLKTSPMPPVLINTIPSPVTNIGDIAFDGENLWVEGYNEYLLFKISPVDGAILKTIPTNIQRPYGLTFGNDHLWVADNDNHLIQEVDTLNGNIIQSFPTPALSVTSYPGGLAWEGQDLWHNDIMGTNVNPNDSTYKLNTSGQILQAYHAFGTYATGLAWDGDYLWSSDNGNLEINKIDVSNFTVIETIEAPGGQYPNGLAWDGQYLWVANNSSDSLYQVDIEYTSSENSFYPSQLFSDFLIYPNPANNELFISGQNEADLIEVSVYNQMGQKVLDIELVTNAIDVSSLDKGMYIIELVSKSSKFREKLMIR